MSDGMRPMQSLREDGELAPVYSISAGFGLSRLVQEHACFKDSGPHVEYVAATDEAVQMLLLSKTEGMSQRLKVRMPSRRKQLNVRPKLSR